MRGMQREQEEQEAWDKERENKVGAKLQVVVTRQSHELEAMKKTHTSARVDMEKSMNMEIAT